MTHRTMLSRRGCLALIGARGGALLLARAARADEDSRDAHQQFQRHGIDQQSVTIVTTTGHYDFLVDFVPSAGRPDSALIARHPVQPDEGILYTVAVVQPMAVSNRGVPFPTDLIFISRDGRIVEIHPAIMADDRRVYTSGTPVLAALQVIAGTVARIAARPGDYVLSQMFGRTL
jgi:uncharacterized membrane protein (UPF0127 family)